LCYIICYNIDMHLSPDARDNLDTARFCVGFLGSVSATVLGGVIMFSAYNDIQERQQSTITLDLQSHPPVDRELPYNPLIGGTIILFAGLHNIGRQVTEVIESEIK
jgi:hypothetical protein